MPGWQATFWSASCDQTLHVQVPELFEELASGDHSSAVGPAVVGHGPSMAHTHRPTHCGEPGAGKATPIFPVDGLGLTLALTLTLTLTM